MSKKQIKPKQKIKITKTTREPSKESQGSMKSVKNSKAFGGKLTEAKSTRNQD
jgi:hypothetical protein